MRQDFILDFETIGQNATKCPIVDCAYVVFSWGYNFLFQWVR